LISALEEHLLDLGLLPPVSSDDTSSEQQTTRAERLAYFAALPTTDEHGEYLF